MRLAGEGGALSPIYYTFKKVALAHRKPGQVLRFLAGRGFWLFGRPKPLSPAMLMFDSTTPDAIPANAQAAAGYVNGKWPTFTKLITVVPRAYRVSIDVFGTAPYADCLDVEKGDATPEQAPAWYRAHMRTSKVKPIFYTSVSQAPLLVSTLSKAGIGRSAYRLWTAHYTSKQHLCSASCGYGDVQADATQFNDRYNGKNLDASLVAPGFF